MRDDSIQSIPGIAPLCGEKFFSCYEGGCLWLE